MHQSPRTRVHAKIPSKIKLDKLFTPLRPLLKSTNNPKVRAMFAANKNETELFRHAETRPLKSGPNKGMLVVDNMYINGDEIARGFNKSIVKFMRKTNCRTVFMNSVCVNHCKVVADEISRHGLQRISRRKKCTISWVAHLQHRATHSFWMKTSSPRLKLRRLE